MDIERIKQQENKKLAQMCLGAMEQIEKIVIEMERMIVELQEIQLKQAKSCIETQKELLTKYFVN